MSDQPILGCIFMFAGNFAPRGYALCAGQILPISQNTALFSLLGTTYGGNGQTTFALPDLRGRLADWLAADHFAPAFRTDPREHEIASFLLYRHGGESRGGSEKRRKLALSRWTN